MAAGDSLSIVGSWLRPQINLGGKIIKKRFKGTRIVHSRKLGMFIGFVMERLFLG